MTVKELKEKLNQFDDSCIVCIPTNDCSGYVNATSVSRGVNEFDMVVFIDDYEEEE